MKYEWNPADYRANSTAQHTLALELVDALALRGDENILDIGCGDGCVTAELARRVPDGFVLGVDNSEGMIALAREEHGKTDARLGFAVGDATSLTFEAEFDVVFSNSALHWIRDHRPVLRGVARALRPGSRFALRMGGKGTAPQVIAAFDVLIRDVAWRDYFVGFMFPYGFHAPDDYVRWLREVGLAPTRVELAPRTADHSRESFSGWVRTTWLPYTHRVPEDRRDEFIRAFVDRYTAENATARRGPYSVDMTRLDAEGVKTAE